MTVWKWLRGWIRYKPHILPRSPRPMVLPLEPRQLLNADLGVAFGAMPNILPPAGPTTATVRVIDTGNSPLSGAASVTLYASPTPVLGPEAVYLSSASRVVFLRPGGKAALRLRFATPPTLASGNYFIIARVRGASAQREIQGTIAVRPLTVTVQHPFVDLVAQFVGQMDFSTGEAGSATVRVINAGNVPALGPFAMTLYASTTPMLDQAASVVGFVTVRNLNLPAGGSKAFTLSISPKLPTGSYRLFALANSSMGIAESNYANNLAVSPAPLSVTPAPVSPANVPHHHHHHGADFPTYLDYGYYDYGGAALGIFIGADNSGIDSSGNGIAPPPDMIGGNADTPPDTGPTTGPSDGNTGGDSSGGAGDPGSGGSGSGDSSVSGDSGGGDAPSSGGSGD